MKRHPDQVQAGQITEIFQKLKTGLRNLGFVLEWRGTSQTLQFILPDDYGRYSTKKWDNLGAIQYYYDSNELEGKPPNLVSFRFYRANLPDEKWLKELEAVRVHPYRQDKISGPSADENSIQIQFIFSEYDQKTQEFIDDLMSLLERLLTGSE